MCELGATVLGEVAAVLLVEDNDGDAFLVAEALRGRPVSVRRESRLDAGIASAAAEPTDVVLLDLSLPDSHGIETVSRTVDELPTVPVVVLTGTDDVRLAEQAVQRGAQDYLVKGRFDAETLARTVRYAIERHRVLGMLREANQELARANERKDDFIAIASHELRTPVSVISAAVQTLLTRSDELDEGERSGMLHMLGRHSARLDALVEDLLVLARADRGAGEPRRRPIDLRATIVAAVEASRVAPEDIELRVPSTTVVTNGDHLTRILVNLLDNAAKYGAPPVEIAATTDGDLLELRVRDHGEGVDPDIEPQLFTRFVRSAEPSVRREPGTGLGLAIIRALTGAIGGVVSHDRPVDGGARFTLQLPLSTPAPSDHPDVAAPAEAAR